MSLEIRIFCCAGVVEIRQMKFVVRGNDPVGDSAESGLESYRLGTGFVFLRSIAPQKYTQPFQVLSRKARRGFAPRLSFCDSLNFVVRGRGLEPPRIAPRAPKARASTNFATPANVSYGSASPLASPAQLGLATEPPSARSADRRGFACLLSIAPPFDPLDASQEVGSLSVNRCWCAQ